MADISKVLQELTGRIKLIEKKLRQPSPDSMGGYWISMDPYLIIPGTDLTATGGVPFIQTIPRDLVLKKVVFSSFTRTTNNSSNHWGVQLVNSSTAVTFMPEQNLQSDPINTWVNHAYGPTFLSISAVDASSDIQFLLKIVKTGAPGNLILAGPSLFFT
jgi:hypothetical protein